MRLAINGFRLGGAITGVPRYLASLLDEWDKDTRPFARMDLFVRHHATGAENIGFKNINTSQITPIVPYSFAEQFLLPLYARGADLLFCPSFIMPIGYKKPCVVTIHDTLQEIMPESFPFWARLRSAPLYRYSARNATLVLTDSENSREDIIRYYRVPENKVRVIHLAAAPCFRVLDNHEAAAKARDGMGLDERPYILFVGKLSVRRNIPALLGAFARLVREEGAPHRLVLVGVNHLGIPLHELITGPDLVERVTHLSRISDQDLAALYNGADCFVLPSSYEGFGLPLIEAMACGCPVVVFRNSSLAEIGKDAVRYPATEDEEGLVEALREVLGSGSLREDLSVRGLKRAAQFSWQKTAQQTLGALEEAANG